MVEGTVDLRLGDTFLRVEVFEHDEPYGLERMNKLVGGSLVRRWRLAIAIAIDPTCTHLLLLWASSKERLEVHDGNNTAGGRDLHRKKS